MAHKPRLFIGSSVESLALARMVQAELEFDAEVTVWNQGLFGASRVTIHELIRAGGQSDAALFVFAPEDIARIRGSEHPIVRDNVLFELGLFTGILGLERVFFLVPRGDDLHLPSDLAGLAALTFEPNRADKNLRSALGPSCSEVRERLKETGVKVAGPIGASAAAAIVTRDIPARSKLTQKHVLLVRRADKSFGLDWQFPAGMVKPNELPVSRAQVEVREETGVSCDVLSELGRRVHPKTHVNIHYFICKYRGGKLVDKDRDENEDVEWVPVTDAVQRLGPDLYPEAAKYLLSLG